MMGSRFEKRKTGDLVKGCGQYKVNNMKFSLILFLIAAVARGQSVLMVSSHGNAQGTNGTSPMMNTFNSGMDTNRLPIYVPPSQHGAVNWKMPVTEKENTNSSASALGAASSFQNMTTTVATNSTTSLNAKAIYRRVGSEAGKLAVAGKVAEVQNDLSK